MPGIDRRTVVKGLSGILAAGVSPAIRASESITLRYLGTAVNQDKTIAERFKADTGIGIKYVAVTTDEVTQRAITSPQSFDLLDIECASLKKVVPRTIEGKRRAETQAVLSSRYCTGLSHRDRT